MIVFDFKRQIMEKPIVTSFEKSNNRNYSVDLFRIICTFGVIILHVPYETENAKFLNTIFWPLCVPFFYTVSVYFFFNALKNSSPESLLKKYFLRLVLPYISWTIIYYALLYVKSIIAHKPFTFQIWRVLFYGESAAHLYFVPTLVLLQTIMFSIYYIFIKKNFLGIITLLISAGYFFIGDLYNCFGIRDTGILFSFVLYIAFPFILSARYLSKIVALVVGLIFVFTSIFLNFYDISLNLLNYPMVLPMGGLGLALISMNLSINKLPEWLLTLTTYSYAIYLVHIIFLEIIEFFFQRVYGFNLFYGFAVKSSIVIIIFTLSLISVYIMRKFKLAKYLLLGER